MIDTLIGIHCLKTSCIFPCLVESQPENAVYMFSSVPLSIPSSGDFRSLCESQSVIFHHLIYAAWAVVLQVYTGADLVVFGSLRGEPARYV
jgi:hypothetical protein